MKEFGILKLRVNNKSRMMHYTTDELYLYMLTTTDTSKVDEIKDNSLVEVSFDLKNDEFIEKECNILIDKDEVKNIFNKMLDEKSTHYKEFNDKLIILRLKK